MKKIIVLLIGLGVMPSILFAGGQGAGSPSCDVVEQVSVSGYSYGYSNGIVGDKLKDLYRADSVQSYDSGLEISGKVLTLDDLFRIAYMDVQILKKCADHVGKTVMQVSIGSAMTIQRDYQSYEITAVQKSADTLEYVTNQGASLTLSDYEVDLEANKVTPTRASVEFKSVDYLGEL